MVPEVQIPESLLKDAFHRNGDGWGIMFSKDNELVIEKGMDLPNLLKFCEEYKDVPELFVHLRMKTHGDISFANTHPFVLGDSGVALMHNGMINTISTRSTSGKSDTAIFVDTITPLVEENPDVIFTAGFKAIVDSMVEGDRLLFLHKDGRNIKLGTGSWTEYDKEGIEGGKIFVSNTYAWSAWKHNNSYNYDSYDGYDYSNYKPATSYSPAPSTTTSTSYTSQSSMVDSKSQSTSTDTAITPYFTKPSATPGSITSPKEKQEENLEYLEKLLGVNNASHSVDVLDIESYTLDELLQMTYGDLEDVGFRDPYLLIEAIYNENLRY